MSNLESLAHQTNDDDFQTEDDAVPTAIPVYGTPSLSTSAAPAVAAQILPTYEMASSTPAHRDWIDKIQVATAESNARVKTEQEWQKVYTGAVEGETKIRELDELLDDANRRANVRNAEGIEIKEDKWLKAALTSKKESTPTPPPELPQQKTPGYQVREYQTKDYSGLHYQSNYEYKSVYE